jgi:predicted secreted protein
MAITSAIVLFAVIWFMVLFVVLPLRLKTQGDVGEIVPGTQAGAPANLDMRRKLRLTTLVALPLWALAVAAILSGIIEVRDFDWMGRLPPEPASDAPSG